MSRVRVHEKIELFAGAHFYADCKFEMMQLVDGDVGSAIEETSVVLQKL